MRLRVDPAAREEAIEAAMWYENQQAGLAPKFLAVFDHALESFERSPESFPMLEMFDSPEIRYCLLKPYAYRAVFRVTESEVVVFAIGHVRRDTDFWRKRIDQVLE